MEGYPEPVQGRTGDSVALQAHLTGQSEIGYPLISWFRWDSGLLLRG
jgi:hypothetical protein